MGLKFLGTVNDMLHDALLIFRTKYFCSSIRFTIKHNTHFNPVSMAALVTLFPAAFVITELLASKLSAKVGIHRYNTANRDTQTSQPNLFLQSTSRLRACGPSHKRISELRVVYCIYLVLSWTIAPKEHPHSAQH